MAEVHPYPEKRLHHTWYWHDCNVVNPVRIHYEKTPDTIVGGYPTVISYSDFRQRIRRERYPQIPSCLSGDPLQWKFAAADKGGMRGRAPKVSIPLDGKVPAGDIPSF